MKTIRNHPFVLVTIGIVALIIIYQAMAISNARHRACVAQIIMMQEAKEMWVYRNAPRDSVLSESQRIFWRTNLITDAHLFNTITTLKKRPGCPSGGIYNLGYISDRVECSFHGGIPQDPL